MTTLFGVETIRSYVRGTVVRCRGTWVEKTDPDDPEEAGTPRDPATPPTVRVKPPGVAAYFLVYGVDLAVKKLSTGIYYLDVATDAEGVWAYRWEAVGGNYAGAAESSFVVKDGAFA